MKMGWTMKDRQWVNEYGEIVRDENLTPPPRYDRRDPPPRYDVRKREQGGGLGAIIAGTLVLIAIVVGVALYVAREARQNQVQPPFVVQPNNGGNRVVFGGQPPQPTAEEETSRGDDFRLGRNGIAVDHVEAMKHYRKAADQGHAGAQVNVGYLYDRGLGVQQDYAEAMKWYRLSADQGNATAQNNVGVLYHNGWGVPQDHGEALRWYRKGTDQNYADSQYNTGLLYEYVYKDQPTAITWYRKAADQNNQAARDALQRLGAK
jgi:tetratricopeptide (TPR) repeat protein